MQDVISNHIQKSSLGRAERGVLLSGTGFAEVISKQWRAYLEEQAKKPPKQKNSVVAI